MAKDEAGAVETAAETEPSFEDTAAAAYEAVQAREAEEAPAAVEAEEAAPEKPAAKPAKAGRERGADGKFVAAAEGAQETPETTETTEQPDIASETESEAATPIASPPSMSAADKAEFAKLPPAMQAFVARRESEVTAGLQQKTQAIAEQKRRYDSVEQVLGPRRQQFAMMGVSEAQALGQLLALSDFATNDINGFLKYMAQNRGVDLRTLINNPDQPAPQVDPVLAATQRQLQELQQSVQAMTSGQVQAQQQQVNNEIEAFRSAKSADGKPQHPHFEVLKVAMGALMQSGQADDLQAAYDMAVRANPTTYAQFQAEQRAADQVKRDADAKAKAAKARQAQGTVLRPTGTVPGKPAPKSMEETAREVYERVNGAAA